MLFFVDDTLQTISGRQAMAIGAVVIPTSEYNALCRAVYRIKQDELGAQQLTEKELKGTSNFAKAAFVRRDDQGFAPHLRAVERLIGVLQDHNARIMAVSSFNPDSLRTRDDLRFPKPYVELIHRMLRYAKYVAACGDGDGLSAVTFDQVNHREDQRVGAAFQNYFTRSTSKWTLGKHFLQVPHFTHSTLSPGIQAADLVAYLACQQLEPSHRPELTPYWDLFKTMDFKYTDADGFAVSSCRALNFAQTALNVEGASEHEDDRRTKS